MSLIAPSGREGIFIARLRQAEAVAAAPAMQSFLAGSAEGVDPNTAGHYTCADPYNPQLVADMEAEISASGRLEQMNETAYVLARDLTVAKHSGVVGFGIFTRADEANVLVDGLYVAPSYRGRHLGPAILDAAFNELAITTFDHLTVDIPESDERTARFWNRIGFIPELRSHTHPENHPLVHIPHREYTGHQLFVQASVRALVEL
jgi:GNAT superfamily N-acetyltransferase